MTAESRRHNDEVDRLIAQYYADPSTRAKNDGQELARRPPWTWSLLVESEAAALQLVVAGFVESYNEVHASKPRLVIPPCWRSHPGLATELAVLAWTWYAVHRDPAATAFQAAEYYLRYLPGFQTRLDDMLGRSPMECRQGNHPNTWRRDVDSYSPADKVSQLYPELQAIDNLRHLHFGFTPSTHD